MESVLAHFHSDVVFTSSVAAELPPETAGAVHGKAALPRYRTAAPQRIPHLHFVVEFVYHGVLRFSDNLVIEGHGTYLVPA